MARISAEQFGDRLNAVLGDRLVALLLYGSAAREQGAAHGARSTEPRAMNTLLIVDRIDADVFDHIVASVGEWMSAKHPAPLVMTEHEWRASADAFPIEYEDIRAYHRVLAGKDPWDGIRVKREHVRRQLEHELKGKLMHLRQAYAAEWKHPKRLTEVVRGTWSGYLTMLRAVLRLAGRDVPASADALVRDAAALIGFSVERLNEPASYLDAVTRTAQYVDRMERTAL